MGLAVLDSEVKARWHDFEVLQATARRAQPRVARRWGRGGAVAPRRGG